MKSLGSWQPYAAASICPRSPVFRLTRCTPEQAGHTTHSNSLSAIFSSSSSQCWTFRLVVGQVNKEAAIRLFSTGLEVVRRPKGLFTMAVRILRDHPVCRLTTTGSSRNVWMRGLATMNLWISGARVAFLGRGIRRKQTTRPEAGGPFSGLAAPKRQLSGYPSPLG